jgi:hypothetical protein
MMYWGMVKLTQSHQQASGRNLLELNVSKVKFKHTAPPSALHLLLKISLWTTAWIRSRIAWS